MPDPIHDLIPHFDPIDPRSVVVRARRRRRTTIGALVAVMVVTLAIILVPTVVVPSMAGRTARPADVTVGTPSAVPSSSSTTPRLSTSTTPRHLRSHRAAGVVEARAGDDQADSGDAGRPAGA